MHTREIAHLRPDQILVELSRRPVAYLPVGPLEWHGPHLPFGVDALNAENAARLAAETTGGLTLPTLYFGTERERPGQMLDWLGFETDRYIVGMDFPANSLPSMYCSEEVLALLVREQLRLAVRFGFKLIVIVTGHAASNQIDVLNRLAVEFSAESPAQVRVALPFVTNPQGIMEVGHASRIETAVMLALHPETVQLDALPPLPQPLRNVDHAIVDYNTFLGDPTPDHTVPPADDPRRATAEDGRSTIEQAVAQIVALVEAEVGPGG